MIKSFHNQETYPKQFLISFSDHVVPEDWEHNELLGINLYRSKIYQKQMFIIIKN